MSSLRLALRLARRELRAGLRGFRIFLACLALGVGAIAAAGSLTEGMRTALSEDARALLGGDLALRLPYDSATAEQREALTTAGAVSETVEMRAMARTEGNARRTLVELKAVDGSYPLYGQLVLAPAGTSLEQRDGVWGAAVDSNLLDRLDMRLGDVVQVGDARFQIRATIAKEPDRVATLFSFGPRLLVPLPALAETGLVQPGSLIRHVYLLRTSQDPKAVKKSLEERFPKAGWSIRDTGDAAPGVGRFLDNITLFLTLVGLTALLIGGIGVANAVKAFMEGRIPTIAILKSVGASRRLVLQVYGLQVAALAGIGILAGLALGAAVPPLLVATLGDALPLATKSALFARPLAIAAGFGALTTLSFALWPLARAADIPAAGLFRDVLAGRPGHPRPRALAVIVVAGLALAALAVATAPSPKLAAWFVGGAAGSLLLFGAGARLLVAAARRIGRAQRHGKGWTPGRLAIGNLHRPGAVTATVVLSLGLGLTVLVAVALVQGNLQKQLAERMPAEAPSFFFIDIQPDQVEPLNAAMAALPGVGQVKLAPMVRGRIERIKGVPVGEVKIAPEAEWAVRGDRGLTMSATPPEGTRIVAGDWWPADYQGPAKVSVAADIARGFGVGVGDRISVNVLGREIEAEVASLREIDWSSLAMNFTFVFTPGTLAGAPHTWIATVHAADGTESAIERAITDKLPNVSSIRVKEALVAVRSTLSAAGIAVSAAAGVALLAGALVLAGAIAAGHRRRVYEAVVLKVLGATRRDLLASFLVEYGLMGIGTGLVAGAVGSLAAWAVLTFVMRADWVFLPGVALLTILACLAATIVFGYAGTRRALAGKAAPFLRNE